ncbi:phage portal protein [Streptomyces cadmiisoli]|uniref:Phage portal protein n=1 Tax=Streptomyces cadmiisoli TaxID=2184053 RepID=A0A2Z4J6Q1_9ACTN|nr:phage portal protein [Streptomyces cadmiisoli]AWW40794.1 phage portal protein [Streptomyces cadmiisoli]
MGLGNLFERRSAINVGDTPTWEDPAFWASKGKFTFSGKRVSNQDALTFPAVLYCVSLIADSVAALPVDTYIAGKQNKQVNNPKWLDQPNPFMTRFDFWHRIMTSLLMDGNAFIYTQRDDSGSVVALYPLDPRVVHIEPVNDGREVKFIVNGEPFDRSVILWIPAFTVPGQARGLSPLENARQAVGLGLTAEEFGARFFGQGTAMTGIIQHPGNPSRDQALMLREMFRKQHSGINNSHSLGILTGGATWQNITITPEQSQFLDTRRFQKTEIALIYRVPANQVDPTVTSSWGSGVEEQNRWFIDQTLSPWLIRIEQSISTYLLPGNRYIKFNLDARLRAKTSERYQAYATGIQYGFINADRIAELEDWEPLPDGLGETYYRPANLTPVTEETVKPVPVPAPLVPDANANDPNSNSGNDDPNNGKGVDGNQGPGNAND